MRDTYIEYIREALSKVLEFAEPQAESNESGNHESLNNEKDEIQYSRYVQRAILYIRENFCDPLLTLEKIARVTKVTPTYLSRIFTQEVGISLFDYLISVRVEEAVKLMKTARFTLTELAEKVGYTDMSYFSRVFKKKMGASPKQYEAIVRHEEQTKRAAADGITAQNAP